jgi:hypothetical protein
MCCFLFQFEMCVMSHESVTMLGQDGLTDHVVLKGIGPIDEQYELQFDLPAASCDVGLKYSPLQFSSRILY